MGNCGLCGEELANTVVCCGCDKEIWERHKKKKKIILKCIEHEVPFVEKWLISLLDELAGPDLI